MRRLLAEGGDVDEGDGDSTPLHIACANNHPDVVAALLSAGAGVVVEVRRRYLVR